jgi:hypothetical protein
MGRARCHADGVPENDRRGNMAAEAEFSGRRGELFLSMTFDFGGRLAPARAHEIRKSLFRIT